MSNNKIDVIIVLCYQRSGSTILDLLMDSHSKVLGTGELFQYYKVLKLDQYCTCGEKIKNCKKWSKIFKKTKENSDHLRVGRSFVNFFLNRNIFLSNGRKIDHNKYIYNHEQIYERIVKYFGKPIILDSSKELDRAELLSRSDKLNVIFLNLVRDGRGVAWSCYKRYGKYLKYMFAWFKTNFKIEIIKIRNPQIKNVYISYNKFTNNPEVSLSKILAAVDCDFEPGMLDFRNKEHHQAGGNYLTRFSKRNKVIEDVEWRRRMPYIYKIIFNVLFGWMNLYYLKKKNK